jgi:hypothetical protein
VAIAALSIGSELKAIACGRSGSFFGSGRNIGPVGGSLCAPHHDALRRPSPGEEPNRQC